MANGTDQRPYDDDEELPRRIQTVRQVEQRTPQPPPEETGYTAAQIPPMPERIPAVPAYGTSEQKRQEAAALHEKIYNQLPEHQWRNLTLPQKIGRIASIAGNVAGETVVPGVMPTIPGTTTNRMMRMRRLEEEIPTAQREEVEATREKAEEPLWQAETERAGAEAAHARAQTAALGNWELLPPGPETVRDYTDASGTRRFEHLYKKPSTGETQWFGEGEKPNVPAPPTAGIPPAGAAPPPQAREYHYGAQPQLTAEQQEEKRVMDLGARVAGGERLNPEEQRFFDANQAKYQTKLPIGPQGVQRYNDQIRQIVSGTNIPPGNFRLDPNMTHGDAAQLLRDARDQADRAKGYRQQEDMLNRREDEKDKRTQVYAVNPHNGQLELTNRYVAEQQWQAVPLVLPAGQIAKDRDSMTRLNDVQMNLSDYNNAIRAQRSPVEHYDAMARIIAGVNESDVQKMGFLSMGAGGDMMEQLEVANSWNKLNPTERDLMIGYLRAKGAMIAYNSVVSGNSRAAVEQLKVDWQNLPAPYVGGKVATPLMRAMQQNLDVLSSKYPTNLPGTPTPGQTRERQEGGPKPPPGAKVRHFSELAPH